MDAIWEGTGVHVPPPSALYSIVSSTPPIAPSSASLVLAFVTVKAVGASCVPLNSTVMVAESPGLLSSVSLKRT